MESILLVRQKIGLFATFKQAISVKRLPKIRSAIILRATMREIADCEEWKMPTTIDDPDILDEITKYLKERGMVGG